MHGYGQEKLYFPLHVTEAHGIITARKVWQGASTADGQLDPGPHSSDQVRTFHGLHGALQPHTPALCQ
jgi:hypothetical protein